MCSVREVLDQLNYRWHGRYPQIKGLLENLTENICGKKSLHVYGPAGTGKTGLLRCDAPRRVRDAVATMPAL